MTKPLPEEAVTDALVEAGAIALHLTHAEPEHGDTWEALSKDWRDNLREHARATISAAMRAATQPTAMPEEEVMRRALTTIADKAKALRHGTDDWFELAEIEQVARAALSAHEGITSRVIDALSYGTLSLTKHMVVMDFEDRGRAEAMFEALDALSAPIPPKPKVDERTRRLVIAARSAAFSDSDTALRELDRASEAFAPDVPWDDQPNEGVPMTEIEASDLAWVRSEIERLRRVEDVEEADRLERIAARLEDGK